MMGKRKIVGISIVAAIAAGVAGKFVSDPYMQNVLVELAGLALALAVGIVAVNVYLESESRQAAVVSLARLIETKINDFHNTFLNLAWAEFGRERYGDIMQEYIKADGKPEALSLEVRRSLYDIAQNNRKLITLLDSLDEGMIELSRLGGWSLDAELLKWCLDFRHSVAALHAVKADGSEEASTAITEHLMDADIRSGLARARLLQLAGVGE